MPRYPPPYGTMVRPVFPPRPPGAVNIPPISRPPVAGIPTVRPIIPPVVRPMVAPSVTPAEKPQNTVYIGKIASTVENEFMLSLLQVIFLSLFFTWNRVWLFKTSVSVMQHILELFQKLLLLALRKH